MASMIDSALSNVNASFMKFLDDDDDEVEYEYDELGNPLTA